VPLAAGDQGATSIDVLDIAFRLDRESAIKIPREDRLPEAGPQDG
jgi:acyl carrier protein